MPVTRYPAEHISEKLDLLAHREVAFIVQRLKLHRAQIVDFLFEVSLPGLPGWFC
jgi:hypothetical protein